MNIDTVFVFTLMIYQCLEDSKLRHCLLQYGIKAKLEVNGKTNSDKQNSHACLAVLCETPDVFAR